MKRDVVVVVGLILGVLVWAGGPALYRSYHEGDSQSHEERRLARLQRVKEKADLKTDRGPIIPRQGEKKFGQFEGGL